MPTKPYLQLRDRISQAWINKYTVLLVLIALKLLVFQQSLQSSLITSKYYTLESCPTIDLYVSNLVSIPHHIAKSSNSLILKTIEEINEKTLDTLELIVTGAENLIIFALEMIVGTYACILVSTVDGAVDVAVNSTESVIGWVNDTLIDITDEIEDGLTHISKFLNKAVSTAEKVKEDFFDGDDDDNDEGNSTLAKINLTVSALKNLHIPSSINTKLDALRDRTPDFTEAKNKTENLIRTPFELIKTKISNATIMSTDGDTLYVPALEQVTICSDNSDKINEFYDHLAKDISFMVKIFVVLLILGALIALITIIYEEIRLWRKLSILQTDLNALNQKSNPKDPIEMIEKTFNKYPTAIGSLASKASENTDTQTSIRWITSYILSRRAIILLGISLAGLLAVGLQCILLHTLSKSISKNMTRFNEITDEITSKVDDSISNWTDSTNDYLQKKEDIMNDDVFGWVKIATDSVNDTVSTFVDEMNEAISKAFNGTILYAPVKTIVGCVIEDKLLKIEQGLTWIHDNAEITLPRVDDDYLTQTWNNDTQGGDNNTTVVMSKASKMVTQTEELMSKMLKRLVEQYKESLRLELWISLALLALWGLQFVIGLVILYLGQFQLFQSWNIKDEKLIISYPRRLTKEEQNLYGYPLSGNLKVMNLAADSVAHRQTIRDPFTGEKEMNFSEKLDMNDSRSTLTNDVSSTHRSTRITNPFAEH